MSAFIKAILPEKFASQYVAPTGRSRRARRGVLLLLHLKCKGGNFVGTEGV